MKREKTRGKDLKWNRSLKGRSSGESERRGSWKDGKEIKLRHENEIIKS
jgi:hypothetical protein